MLHTITGVAGLVAGTTVSATFGEDGTVAGTGGCNTFTGPYSLDGDSLSIGNLAATMMACPDDVMRQESAYALELRDAAGAVQVRFEVGAP